ncbi:MAG: glycoside hydrolase, partial [Actinobacteria bacterium]|nr:glycoside hydrolase [Actinomycetota bacterium]
MKRSPWALAAVVVGLAVVLGATFALLGGGGTPAAGPNALVNPPGLITVNNSPTVARHPDRPDHLAVTHRLDRPGFSALLEWSDDGGATWQPTSLPLPAEVVPCAASPQRLACPFAPSAAFGPDGTLHVIYVSLQGPGNTPGALWASTSTDGGRTLAPPVRVAGELTFQPRLAVGPDGVVHLTWLQAAEVALNRLVGQARVVASRSTDGGASFSTPVPVSDAG